MPFTRKVIPLIIAGMISIPVYSDKSEQEAESAANPPTQSGIETEQKEASGAIDAKSQIDGMAKKLAGARQFSVSIHMNYDVVQASGQKIQFSEVRKVWIRHQTYSGSLDQLPASTKSHSG